jgi:hypothetical protein
VFTLRPLGNFNEVRRIDLFCVDVLRLFWKKLLALRYQVWLWWRYTLREPFIDPDQANEALRELCGYKVLPSTEAELKCCLPGFFRFKFGVLVFFVPIHQRSRHWTLCWVRWLDDSLELYLVRLAARAVSHAGSKASEIRQPGGIDQQTSSSLAGGLRFFDSISTGDLENLLGK